MTTSIDRRSFATGLAFAGTHLALGVATAASASASAAAAPAGAATNPGAGGAFDDAALEAPANLHRVYRRLRFAADERIVFWWMKGRRYGFVDTVMTPFFDMQVGSMHRCRDLGDGRWELRTASAMYHTDIATGALLEDWANPVTGKTVKFDYPAPTASTLVYSYTDGVQDSPVPPGMKMERRHYLGPLERIGDEAWVREEGWLNLVYPNGRGQRVHDMYNFSAPLAALRPAQPGFVPATVHFNDYNGWSPRFQMGDAPGASVSRCSGRKVARVEELPASFLQIARRLHGAAYADPARTLG
jgi:hypothetical protein